MSDQAAGLRSLFARRRPSLLVVAGSDVGKAAVAVHFARESAAAGRATVLIDGTAGQAASACDVACRYELAHVLAGDLAIGEVLKPLMPHLLLLPSARALSRFGSFTADEEARLVDVFSNGIADVLRVEAGHDVQVDLIVVNADEAQGGRALEAFGRDARVVIVASDHAPSLRGAYVEMKALAQEQGVENFEIVVPVLDDAVSSGVAFANLAKAARRFLDIEVTDGGTVGIARPKDLRSHTRVPTGRQSGPVASPSSDGPGGAVAATPVPLPTHSSLAEVPHAAVA